MRCESSIRADVKNKTIDQWQAYHTSLLERLEREVAKKAYIPTLNENTEWTDSPVRVISLKTVLDLIKQAKEGKL